MILTISQKLYIDIIKTLKNYNKKINIKNTKFLNKFKINNYLNNLLKIN